MSQRIFVALSTFAEYGQEPLDLLEESGLDFFLNPLKRRVTRDEIIEMGKNATGIIAGIEPYDAMVLNELKSLRCISRCGVGVDNIDLNIAEEKGIVIRNTPDVVIQPVVELTIAMAFDLMRRLSLHTGLLRSKTWKKSAGNLLAGKTVGILGMGRIGRKVAEAFLKLGTKVIGTDLQPDEKWAAEQSVEVVSLETLLKKADILSIHISAIADNPFTLDDTHIHLMKKGSWIINTSRGNLVDEKFLYNALKAGRLAGAALDVFPEEPYSGPLCDLDNVVLTPHVATLTKESRVRMETEAVANLLEMIIKTQV